MFLKTNLEMSHIRSHQIRTKPMKHEDWLRKNWPLFKLHILACLKQTIHIFINKEDNKSLANNLSIGMFQKMTGIVNCKLLLQLSPLRRQVTGSHFLPLPSRQPFSVNSRHRQGTGDFFKKIHQSWRLLVQISLDWCIAKMLFDVLMTPVCQPLENHYPSTIDYFCEADNFYIHLY